MAVKYQYPVYDHRGNVVAVTDENGAVVSRFEYNAWGEKLHDAPPAEGTRFGQSAPAWFELSDSNDTLGLSPARLYHKPTGRFLQRDPLAGLNGGQALADGDPIMLVDPNGLAEPLDSSPMRRLQRRQETEQRRITLIHMLSTRGTSRVSASDPLAFRGRDTYLNARDSHLFVIYIPASGGMANP